MLQMREKVNNWTNCKLGDFLTFHYGKSLSTEKRVEGNIPVYSSAGLTGWHNEALVESEGLIIGRKGTIGKVYKSKQPFFVIDTAYYIKPDQEKYDLNYIYYLLSSIGLDELNEDSAVPGLNRNTAYAQEILLPPLEEQKAIAEVLSSLDGKIDLLHKQNKTLEQLAETLFRHHFIDNAQDDWEEVSVGDIVSIKGGTTPSTKNSEYWNGDISWTTPRDLSSHVGVFLFNTERKITEKGLSEIGSGLMQVGTVLMSSRAPIGYLAISEIPVAINQGYIAIVCDKKISNYFMFLWCKANMDEIKNAGNGSTFEEISKTSFKEMKFLMPNSTKEFDQEVGQIFEKIKINQKQIRNLEKLREQLLPKLMNGEVIVKINERKKS